MKAYYRKKGKYKDGRTAICIEWQVGVKKYNRALPKPEILLPLFLDGTIPSILKKGKKEEKSDGQN